MMFVWFVEGDACEIARLRCVCGEIMRICSRWLIT
jgi:hypothetical protein